MSGKRLRVYVDTSVIGGCGDDEFKGPSTRIVQKFISGEAIIVVSDVLIAELSGAPDGVQAVLRGIPPANVEYVTLNDEATRLAEEYVRQGALSPRMIADAQHIAVATVARVDDRIHNIIPPISGRVTLSWRFGVLGRYCKMNQKVKEFDSVQLMRRLRDQLSDEMAPMSSQERILYIQRKAAASPLSELFSHKTQTGDAERLVQVDG